ncbi:MAG TPA: class I SAM-dependent methyltransferase [Candidatus Acidoferrales bacterium]
MHTLATPLSAVWQPVRRVLKPIWYGLFRYHPYHYLGALAWAVMGQQARRSFLDEFSKPFPRVGLRQHCLREYWNNVYFAQYADSPITPGPLLNQLWGGSGATEYHAHHLQYFTEHMDEFVQVHTHLFNQLAQFLAEEEFDYVVEVGCGSGMIIERVAAQAEHSRAQFVGLDLNPEIIALNRQRHPHSRVQYHQAKSLQEFLSQVRPASVLVFANATFTFFTELELQNCLNWLATHVPCGAIVIADATVLDVRSERHSRPYGVLTFSHNYDLLLRQAGLKQVRCDFPPAPSPTIKKVLASATWGTK